MKETCGDSHHELADETQVSLSKKIIAHEHIEERDFDIEFHWISLEKVKSIEIYPSNESELLEHINEGVKHFVYREN